MTAADPSLPADPEKFHDRSPVPYQRTVCFQPFGGDSPHHLWIEVLRGARPLDKDNDGTLDLAEVKAAAAGVFDKLDKDSDATLDRKEIGGRAGKTQLQQADPDHDGTLTKDEYLDLVEKLFNAADADKDGTLDPKELKSNAGRALSRLIQP